MSQNLRSGDPFDEVGLHWNRWWPSVWSFPMLQLMSVAHHQITKDALERSELKRGLFRIRYGNQYMPEQTVFVDQSSFDRRTAIRGRAWALSGQRAVRKCFFVRGRRCAFLACKLLHSGLIFPKDILSYLHYQWMESFGQKLWKDHIQNPFSKNLLLNSWRECSRSQETTQLSLWIMPVYIKIKKLLIWLKRGAHSSTTIITHYSLCSEGCASCSFLHIPQIIIQ